MEKFVSWLGQNTKIKTPKSYAQGVEKFTERQNLSKIFEANSYQLNDLLNTFDENTIFEKNDKSHLKRFVESKGLDPNEYSIFDRKENEKKSKKTEKTAIKDITEHFTKEGYEVKNVETDNCGWDLEAIKGNENLLLEVKGLSGKFYTINLSENEYKKLKELDKKNQKNYRICIVTNCKSAKSKRVKLFLKYDGSEFLSDINTLIKKEEIISVRLRSDSSKKRLKN
ncbi:MULTISPECIES: protein NO VEIN domain-containing protein [unclassified Kaistella]|uniref:protein NO VEIN domain-containing protein n=1 Tax=unclassified Kaistella TaxID=2762626 RepID=UPI00273325AC|nr:MULTISPECIES: DUF3883 domain-containing protein [unclassified Kaistella]MDP2454671.1 DUF3883 domain-containing protein [Kaistella sp. SH11-4b]MDP2457408.1 DUF3883 domain-containing protein [Kaistella sp. SH40-3]MDP2460168.1 DUF3883 domain-containing protein [Kaistella sp. SH19-2b]